MVLPSLTVYFLNLFPTDAAVLDFDQYLPGLEVWNRDVGHH